MNHDHMEPALQSQKPYQIYTETDYKTPVKLSVGEYDSPLPAAVRQVIRDYLIQHMEEGCLYYPSCHSPVTARLKAAICKFNELPDPDDVLLTAGSTESLRLIMDSLLDQGDAVLIPTPSYSNAINLIRRRTQQVFSIDHRDLEAVRLHLDQRQRSYKLVYLTSPNNPMGFVHGEAEIEALARAHPDTTFLVDGCYLEFLETFPRYHANLDNLIVTRTFSKAFGLAGLRIGYLYSSPTTSRLLQEQRDPHLPTELSKAAACAALASLDEYREIWSELRQTRRWLIAELEALGLGIDCSEQGMFVVAQLPAGHAAAFCDTLRHEHGILIKALGGQGSGQGYDDRIRIGLGSRAKLEQLLEAIGKGRPDPAD